MVFATVDRLIHPMERWELQAISTEESSPIVEGARLAATVFAEQQTVTELNRNFIVSS